VAPAGSPRSSGATGNLHARLHAAAALLSALGGEAYVEKGDDTLQLRGYGCPLSAAVTSRGRRHLSTTNV
jgi:hypothetical protein